MQARHVVTAALLLAACARGRSDEPVGVDGSSLPSIDAPDGIAIDAPRPDGPPATACADVFSGTLAAWTFTGESGSQASTNVSANAHNVVAGAVTRATALTAVSGSGSINSSNWPTATTRDATKHYAFTISPPSGCTLTLTGVMIDARASGTGPAQAQLATSVDNFAAASAVSTTAPATVAFTATATGTIEVRVYGFAAGASMGTLRLQNTLAITGDLQ